jgi:prophage regulatory protein
MMMTNTTSLQRLRAVLTARGATRATHYRDIQKGLWTRPVKVGSHMAAWPAHETQALIAAQIGGASPDEIRELVGKLHDRRKTDFALVESRYLLPLGVKGGANGRS